MMRMSRIATRFTVVAAALAVGVAVAPAASAKSEQKNLDVQGLFTDEVITGRMTLEGTVTRLLDLKAVTRTVDELGRAITSPQTVALRASSGNPRVGNYSCLPKSKGNRNFTQFSPTEIYRDDDKGKLQALFHLYRQVNARKIGGETRIYRSTQFELCGVGGFDPDGKSRTRKSGIGVTFPDAHSTYKIGQAWKEGSTPANYTLDLAFEAAHKSGVSIGAGISQTPTNKILGSISTPIEAPVDEYARNAANAWWQDSCVGSWHGCRFMHGSKDFHGSVVHGLWEFTPEQAHFVARNGFLVSTFRSAS